MPRAQRSRTARPNAEPILRAEERVRRELARELHDGPLQALAAMEMRLQFIKRLAQLHPERVTFEIEELQELVQNTMQQIRGLLFELRPLILETQGLIPALQFFLEQFAPHDVPRVTLNADALPGRLPPHSERALFSIIREAVINAFKHAQASNVWIVFESADDGGLVTICDDGVGFSKEAAQQNYLRQRSLGIVNMKERADRIGAQLAIDSAPGQGTKVTVTLPATAWALRA